MIFCIVPVDIFFEFDISIYIPLESFFCRATCQQVLAESTGVVPKSCRWNLLIVIARGSWSKRALCDLKLRILKVSKFQKFKFQM